MAAFMFDHLPILPIAIPLVLAAVALLLRERWLAVQRIVCLFGASLLLAIGVLALGATQQRTLVYLVGNWQAPFGIALAVDQLAAIMITLTAFVGTVVLIAMRNVKNSFFHPLMMLQWMGLNGAFLTADLFNLFVFFEVLLAASYGMLLQGVNGARANAATPYVVINLVGSALFLIAVSLLYGVTGTLNMADLSLRIEALASNAPQSVVLARIAVALLLVVFAIKAALLPLGFWLTSTYGAALAPVAALFALMTKVGVYSITRTVTLIAPASGEIGAAAAAVFIWVGPLTLLLAAIGSLTARQLGELVGWTIMGSAGLLVTAVAVGSAKALSGAVFYLIGSTLAAALLFLLQLGIREGHDHEAASTAAHATAPRTWAWVAGLFMLGAIAAVGLPPLSGFIGKAVLLAAAAADPGAIWLLIPILTASFLTLFAYARMGSRLFWKRDATVSLQFAAIPAGALAVALCAMAIFAAPLQRMTDRAAVELLAPTKMIGAVLGSMPKPSERGK
jgi:multicomponent K+:H+ antiporter subunit D